MHQLVGEQILIIHVNRLHKQLASGRVLHIHAIVSLSLKSIRADETVKNKK